MSRKKNLSQVLFDEPLLDDNIHIWADVTKVDPSFTIHRGKMRFQHPFNEFGQKRAWASSSWCMEEAPGGSGS